MRIIIKHSESRLSNFFLFLFLLGIGVLPLWLAGGIFGWVFFAFFAFISFVVLLSVLQPKTSLLGVQNDHLVWWTISQFRERLEDVSVPINAIRKLIKLSQPGGRSVELRLVLADNTVLILPEELRPEVNSKKIISSIRELSHTIEFEEADLDEADDTISGDTVTTEPKPNSSRKRQPKTKNKKTIKDKDVWKFTLLFVIIGVPIFLIAAISGLSTYRFVHAGTFADGTIQKMALIDPWSSHRYYQPTIAFADQSGQKWAVTQSGGSNPPDYRVGQKVRVIYDPKDPSGALIYDFQTLWLSWTFPGVIGLVFTILGSVGTRLALRLRRP